MYHTMLEALLECRIGDAKLIIMSYFKTHREALALQKSLWKEVCHELDGQPARVVCRDISWGSAYSRLYFSRELWHK